MDVAVTISLNDGSGRVDTASLYAGGEFRGGDWDDVRGWEEEGESGSRRALRDDWRWCGEKGRSEIDVGEIQMAEVDDGGDAMGVVGQLHESKCRSGVTGRGLFGVLIECDLYRLTVVDLSDP